MRNTVDATAEAPLTSRLRAGGVQAGIPPSRVGSPLRTTLPETPEPPLTARRVSTQLRSTLLEAVEPPPPTARSRATSEQLDASRMFAYCKRTALQGNKRTEYWTKAATLLLQIRLETSTQLLHQLGEFTTAYARVRFHPRTAEKLALASNELIENAISYCSISGDVVYMLYEAADYVEVCVANNSSTGRLSNLRSIFDRIRVDPQQVLHDEMTRSVTGNGAKAALGLARICAEGQMDLELEIEANRVTMHARCGK